MTELLDTHAPLTTKVVTIRPDTSWFTEEIRISKQRRREAEETWRKTKLTVHREIYKQARAKTNALIIETKAKSIRNKVYEKKGDSKQLFNVLNGMMKVDNNKRSLPTHQNKSELADQFNNYFINKIATIRSNMDNAINCEINTSEAEDPNSPLESCILSEFSSASTTEIGELIKKSPNKQCKLDVVPTWLMKQCVSEIAPAITSIANRSIEQADVPNCFKEALITPIIKKKNLDCDSFKNYRPISNLNFISKLIEKLIVKRLNEHLNTHNLHAPVQSAYKQSHSTETALLRVHNDIVDMLDTNDNALLLLLDLSAAFDTVDHKILLDRMKNIFGIRDKALEWFSCYLRGRSQCVIIDDAQSPSIKLLFGVPQGSVLGPFLFTMYTKPLSNIIASFSLSHHLYADDTQIYSPLSFNNIQETTQQLVSCFCKIKAWMTNNKLKFNEEKTELIVFKKTSKKILINQMFFGESKIQNSTVIRNLGVYFDTHLDMNAHITKCCQAIHNALRMICKIRNVIDDETCKMLIHALVTSRMDYCNSLLFGLPKSSSNRLQKMQNKAARIVTRTKPHDHITPVLKSLHWLPVEERIKFKIACFAFNCIHDTSPGYLKSLVSQHRPARSLRSSSSILLKKKIPKTKFAERGFKFSAPTVWNSLSDTTRQSENMSAFKRHLKTDLFRTAYSL